MEYTFDSSNTMLKLLVVLFIILLFGFGPQNAKFNQEATAGDAI